MIATIRPSRLAGEVHAPPSKSISQRAIALAYLHSGITTLHNIGQSRDEKAALEIIEALGAATKTKDGNITVTSKRKLGSKTTINCGESGLSCRMFIPIAALAENEISITGEGSLLKRPIHLFRDIFPQLGVRLDMSGDHLPLTIKGPLLPRDLRIDGSLSSQYLTGLLFAFASANHRATISVSNLVSKPYIDLSLQLLHAFGYNVTNEGYEHFTINPVIRDSAPIDFRVEGDWSNAAFWLVAGAINGNLTVRGLNLESQQGDRQMLSLLRSMRLDIREIEDSIAVRKGEQIPAFEFDATDCPDLFPPLAILAAHGNGKSAIKGIQRLRLKESDRQASLTDLLVRLGVMVSHEDDHLYITGSQMHGAAVSAHADHRIAMAAAIAGLNADGNTIIHGAEAVNKSYRDFFLHLQSLGGELSLQP